LRRSLPLLVVALALAALKVEVARPAPPEVKAVFGILAVGGDGKERFVETTVVPSVDGQSYGWVAAVEPVKDVQAWTEEITLPKAPESWGDAEHDPDVAISGDHKTATTHGKTHPGESVVSHFWGFSSGDPLGRYRIRLTLPGGRVATFDFDVKDVPTPTPPAPGEVGV
jgi:hypothetical protein